jgi:IS5 family transposase
MLREKVSQYFLSMQQNLFPGFADDLGLLTDRHRQLIVALDVIQVERFSSYQSLFAVGRPPINRDSLARAFIAKAILNIPTTVALIDRIKADPTLRRLCGFNGKIPCEATFSNAFDEFAEMNLPGAIHEALVREQYEGQLVGHVSRDATAIVGREKPTKKTKLNADAESIKNLPIKRGRPKKDEQRSPKEPTRIERQLTMDLSSMLADLPKDCDVGGKKNSQGNAEWWIGYKLHLDVDDRGIPLTAIVTSASMHDSQAAIPLEMITNSRVTSLYSVMDAAYNSEHIETVVTSAGKVAIIDPKKPRGGEKTPLDPAKQERYKIRTTVERTNSAIKDDFGGRYVRVRGHAKVSAHLMFGVLTMTALRMIDLFT